MKTIHRLFTTFGAIAVIGGVLSTPPAYAVDEKVYPGSMCSRLSGGTAQFTVNGQLFNSGTSEMQVLCPIVRDNTTAPYTSIMVSVIDQNAAENVDVKCTVRSNSIDGVSLPHVSGVASSSGNSNVGQLVIIPTTAEYDNGHFVVRCNIPAVGAAKSGILSYRVVEQ